MLPVSRHRKRLWFKSPANRVSKMQKSAVLLGPILLVALTIIYCSPISCLDYPKNFKELEFIEHCATTPHSITVHKKQVNLTRDQIAFNVFRRLEGQYALVTFDLRQKERVEGELKRLGSENGHMDEEVGGLSLERKLELIHHYIDIANEIHLHCPNQTYVSELLFLMNYHEGQQFGSSMNEYLGHYIFEHFKSCKQVWDVNLARTVRLNLDKWTRDNMFWLMETLITVKFGDKPGKLVRPLERPVLAQLVADLPPAGLVLYMSRTGDLMLDDNMKNPSLTWTDFRQIVDVTVMPLCRDVCRKLESATDPYNSLFEFAFATDQMKEAESLFAESSDLLSEWLASKQICCTIVRAFDSDTSETSEAKSNDKVNILRRTYNELVKEEESWDVGPEFGKLVAKCFGYD